MNSGPLHQVIINQTLLYLKRHSDLNLQLDEDDEYMMTSDVLFADNTTDHKSSQSYAMKLFENLVE